MVSTLSVVHLGTPDNSEVNTASRAVVEQVAAGRYVAHVVISPIDLGAFATEYDASMALANAMGMLALRVRAAFADAKPPSTNALDLAHAMASGQGAPPMTDADIVALAHTLDGNPSTSPNVVPVIPTAPAAFVPTTPPFVAPVGPGPVTSIAASVAPSNVVAAHTAGAHDLAGGAAGAVIVDTGHAPVAPSSTVNALGHHVDIVEAKSK